MTVLAPPGFPDRLPPCHEVLLTCPQPEAVSDTVVSDTHGFHVRIGSTEYGVLPVTGATGTGKTIATQAIVSGWLAVNPASELVTFEPHGCDDYNRLVDAHQTHRRLYSVEEATAYLARLAYSTAAEPDQDATARLIVLVSPPVGATPSGPYDAVNGSSMARAVAGFWLTVGDLARSQRPDVRLIIVQQTPHPTLPALSASAPATTGVLLGTPSTAAWNHVFPWDPIPSEMDFWLASFRPTGYGWVKTTPGIPPRLVQFPAP